MDRDKLKQAAALGSEGNPVYSSSVPLHKIDLRKLRHATVLAFEGNFSRAAEKLHITPSALSQSITSLEKSLGLLLFERAKSGVTLSTVGRQFIGRIDKLLFDARGLLHDLTLAGEAVAGEAIFGLRTTPARIFLSDMIQEMLQECPKLKLKIATTLNEILIQYLLLEGLEFVICDAPVHTFDGRLSSRLLASLPLELFVRIDHPLTKLENFSLDDLKQYTIASPHQIAENYDSVRAWLGLEKTEDFPSTFWCDDYDYLMDAVLHNDAVLLAPSLAVTKEKEANIIRIVTPCNVLHQSNCELHLITLADRNVSPAIKLIIQKIEILLASKMSLVKVQP